MNPISVVIIAKDAQDTIRECLEHLTRFDEVLVYLNNSTDQTKTICENFDNVSIVEGEFIGFGPTKNRAASFARHDWILSLDSDEILDDTLIDEIFKQDFQDINNLFILERINYFLGKPTVSNDKIVRMYNKTRNSLNDNQVHEKIEPDDQNNLIELKTKFKHLNITNINQTLYKTIKYTDLASENKKMCFFSLVIAKATFAFLHTYFIKGYMINGWAGFTVAITLANRRFYKYLKMFINCQKAKREV